MEAKEITSLMRKPSMKDEALIGKALAFATKAHEGQKRFSGEPYIVHPFEVAKMVAELRADTTTIAAALLHDTLEDTPVTAADLEKEFGADVRFLVEGVTKLGKLKYQGLERHAESLRKLFVAMAKDIRVILIRLADRWHNIHTLEHVRPDKQKRIATETLEIYAPLANRLGIWRLKGLLEDGSFPYVYPKEYATAMRLRKTKGKETLRRLEKIYKTLSRTLAERGLKNAAIDYRVKYLYSLYQKLRRYNMDIEQIYDISALRVVVGTVEECYQVLGVIHQNWRPVPGRLKDYIANPKQNGYQSIHTAIFAGDGSIAEIQIRTTAMQEEAEYGVASHVAYSEMGKPAAGGQLNKRLAWVQQLLEWQKTVHQPEQFLTGLKTDFFQDTIFVFTPKGDVVELPVGATPIDFAYAIHSGVGDQAAGARVNGKFVALHHILHNQDIVEIETKKTSRPSHKWLEYAKTNTALKHIRSALTLEEAAKSKRQGRR